jgi:predicted nucleotidyltransferase
VDLKGASARVANAASDILSSILQERLTSIAAFGSAVTGDFFPGISDLDLLVTTTTGLTVADFVRLQQAAEAMEVRPFSSIQAIYFRATDPTPSLVPGGYAHVAGPPMPSGFLRSELDLRESGQLWLQGHHQRCEMDLFEWSMAVDEKLPRIGRLLVTRIKPTVRALLARRELNAAEIWLATWDELIVATQEVDELLSQCIIKLTEALRADPIDWGVLGRRSIYTLDCIPRLM